MASRFSIEAVFSAIDRMTAPMNRMKNGVRGLKLAMDDRGFAASFNRAGKAAGRLDGRVRAIGSAAMMAGTAGAYGLTQMVSGAMDVEHTLAKAGAKMDGIRRGTAAFKQLEDAAVSMSKNSRFSALEVAQGLDALSATGFNAASSIAVLPRLTQLATAADVDFGEATMWASEALGNFGLLLDKNQKLLGGAALEKNLARVGKTMADVSNLTSASMGQIYETITEAGPIAKAAGLSFEKFVAMTGALAQAGIKGSVAGTSMKNVLTRLLAPTSESAKEIENLGLNVEKFRNIGDVTLQLKVLSKAMAGLSVPDRMKAIDEIFGKIPMAAAEVLLSGGTESALAMMNQMESTGDSLAKLSDLMGQSSAAKIKRLDSAFKGVGYTMFRELSPTIDDVAEKMTNWLIKNEPAIARFAKGAFVDLKNGIASAGQALQPLIPMAKWASENIGLITELAIGYGKLKVAMMIGGTARDAFQLASFAARAFTVDLIAAQTATAGITTATGTLATTGVSNLTLFSTALARMGAVGIAAKTAYDIYDWTQNPMGMNRTATKAVDDAMYTDARKASSEDWAIQRQLDRELAPQLGIEKTATGTRIKLSDLVRGKSDSESKPAPGTPAGAPSPAFATAADKTLEKTYAEVKLIIPRDVDAKVTGNVPGLKVVPQSGAQ